MSDVALLLACPSADLDGATERVATFGLTLLPAGGAGDLDRCTPQLPLYLVVIDEDGAQPAATWFGRLLGSVPLDEPSPEDLLPPSWNERHADVYARARTPVVDAASRGGPGDDEDGEDGEGEETAQQMFIPVTDLKPLARSSWLFTNELVPKQARGGRRFAPLVPTLVQLPG